MAETGQDHSTPDDPTAPAALGQFATGDRVTRHGTVSYVRSGFARVRWDDGRSSDEWCTDLIAERADAGAVGALREVARLLDRSTQTGKAPTQGEWAALTLANATLDTIEGR